MLQKLDFLVRFWQLRARHHALGTPLSEAECGELWSLLRLVSSERGLPDPGPAPSNDQGIPIQLTAPGGFVAGEVRRVHTEGLVVVCARPLPPGASTIVRLADAVTGIEYALPCSVEWTFTSSPSAMALRINGAPTRTTFAIPEPGMWRSPFALGAAVSHRA